MKSLIKVVLLAVTIGLTSFTVLNTKAANIKTHQAIPEANIVVLFSLHSHNHHANELVYSNSLFSSMAVQSTTTTAHSEDSCPSNKANEVYELTALFNDKLQMLISYFTSPKNGNHLEEIEDNESIQVVSISKS
ncbi:hypothetical protein ACOYR1_03300 [Thalassotalea piscium]